MKLIMPSFSFIDEINHDGVMVKIANVAKTCYQSGAFEADKDKDVVKASKMVQRLVSNGHLAMIEHGGLFSVKIITDRAIANEIVRHRMASYAQESTRYVNLGKNDIEFIIPYWCTLSPGRYVKVNGMFYQEKVSSDDQGEKIERVPAYDNCLSKEELQRNSILLESFIEAEDNYVRFLAGGGAPQEARAFLPLGVKTEIVVSMNLREWKYFFDLRAKGITGIPHPDLCSIAKQIYTEFQLKLPEIFN